MNNIERIILDGNRRKVVLINQKLIKELPYIRDNLGCFNRLAEHIGENPQLPGIAFNDGTTMIYNGFSFAYTISNVYIANLRNTIIEFLPELA